MSEPNKQCALSQDVRTLLNTADVQHKRIAELEAKLAEWESGSKECELLEVAMMDASVSRKRIAELEHEKAIAERAVKFACVRIMKLMGCVYYWEDPVKCAACGECDDIKRLAQARAEMAEEKAEGDGEELADSGNMITEPKNCRGCKHLFQNDELIRPCSACYCCGTSPHTPIVTLVDGDEPVPTPDWCPGFTAEGGESEGK